MKSVWAVARQMIAEGIRMKLAIVFLLLIGAVVLGLPFSVRGDSSLTGAVQSFMQYSLSATSVFLGMLTIFMSRSLSDELVNHQILLVLTKPIPRWQFVLGKWLGIVTLTAVFLASSGVCIFGMVHYIKATHPPIDDKFDMQELTSQILVARHVIQAKLPDFTRPAEQEYQRNLEEGMYANIPNFSPDKARATLRKKHEARWRVVAPWDMREFLFENVLCDRSADKTVQLRYKANISMYPPDEIYRARWSFGDPMKGVVTYDALRRDVIDRYHTMSVPADCVAPDNTLKVTFINQNPYRGEPLYRNVMEFRKSESPELLFIVGSFGWNLFRLLILIMCKLMFVAAVAVLAATVFSFPVACLTSFTVYVVAAARSFIDESLEYSTNPTMDTFSSIQEVFVRAFTLLFEAIGWVIPDFGYYNAIEDFVNGRNVSLVWVLQGIGELALFKTMIVLGIAMLLFHRREVAEISV